MRSFSHPQLPLGFEASELFTFDSFVAGENEVATALARQSSKGEGEKQLYFWGESGLSGGGGHWDPTTGTHQDSAGARVRGGVQSATHTHIHAHTCTRILGLFR